MDAGIYWYLPGCFFYARGQEKGTSYYLFSHGGNLLKDKRRFPAFCFYEGGKKGKLRDQPTLDQFRHYFDLFLLS